MSRRRGVLLCLALAGCATSREAQLQRVAKDWCETIRASQVIPVYPLTEDLQPGDIFLVQQTVEDQHKVYEEDGFLALDNHLGRVNPTGYAEFYKQSFTPAAELPKVWLTTDPAWKEAPSAAFPSYSFATEKGGGFNLALPISGVPVGMSLLGAEAATGSVTISDARTVGVDTDSLYADVLVWAARHEALLQGFGTRDGGGEAPNYLRVVSRVYLAGRMTVALQETRSFGAGATAGASKPVELLAAETVDSGKEGSPAEVKNASIGNYKENLKTLNEAIGSLVEEDGKLLPGGQAKVVSASARSITLDETFPRPLVVGYLGFDMRILEGGRLGRPIPSHAVVVSGQQPGGIAFFTADEQAYLKAMRKAKRLDAGKWRAILGSLDPELVARFDEKPDYARFRELVAGWLEGAVSDARMAAATATIAKETGGLPDTDGGDDSGGP
jgi:hypothetical protein